MVCWFRVAIDVVGQEAETSSPPGDAVVKKSGVPHAVSANNPCPFLRALVSMGKLSDDREPLTKMAAVVAATARTGDGLPVLPRTAIFAIASVANGLGPLSLLQTQWNGLQSSALRGGPLSPRRARDPASWTRASPGRNRTPTDQRNSVWDCRSCGPTWTPTSRAPLGTGGMSIGR